jgi:hypothetical protein
MDHGARSCTMPAVADEVMALEHVLLRQGHLRWSHAALVADIHVSLATPQRESVDGQDKPAIASALLRINKELLKRHAAGRQFLFERGTFKSPYCGKILLYSKR